MKVLLARHAGFCMGVRRAVDATLATLEEARTAPGHQHPIATYGPLIHNPQVLDLLHDRGVATLKEVPATFDGTVIIRAHGVPPEDKEALANAGAQVRDATCPRVTKVQVIIDKYREKGYRTVIIGDADHAEVQGLMGHAGDTVQVVSRAEDVDRLVLDGPYIVVSQTTQNEKTFEELAAAITSRFPGGRVFNTICDSTHKRQEEVRQLAQEVDAMVVVGGKASANTARLGEIAREMGCPVFMVESEEDLDLEALSRYRVVGVTAGASTPTWMINLVVRVLESLPSPEDGRVKPLLQRLFWLVFGANISVALAAAALALAACTLMAVPLDWRYCLVAAGYVLAMHNLNRFTQIRAKQINDPVKAYFATRHKRGLTVLSVAALAGALTAGATLGPAPFFLLLVTSGLGVMYSMGQQPVPRILHRLRQLPGSKTLLVSLAWASAAALVPALATGAPVGFFHFLWTFLVVLGVVYVRCALFDVVDIHGDRIVGRETLPVLVGEDKTLTILHGILEAVVVLLLVLPLVGGLAPVAWPLAPTVGLMILLAHLYQKKRLTQGPQFEFLLEGVFWLMGLVALVAG